MPTPVTALIHSVDNISFICESDPHYMYSVLSKEWEVNGKAKTAVDALNRTLCLPPILKYSNAEVVCKLTFKAEQVLDSCSDPYVK